MTVGGAPCRLFRVSFSGELAYEIAVAADFGDALMRMLMEAGAEYGIAAYGTEALNVLRIEKGHASGPEIDGRTTLRDLGLAKLGSRKKDSIGRVMAERPALVDEDRPTLVGLQPVDPADKLLAGAHLIAPDRPSTAEHAEGHVTSVAHSPTLGHDIAIAFLHRGPARIGETTRIVDLLRECRRRLPRRRSGVHRSQGRKAAWLALPSSRVPLSPRSRGLAVTAPAAKARPA